MNLSTATQLAETKAQKIFSGSLLPKIFKAGTKGGNDFDIGIIWPLLGLTNIWVAFWKFDIFINDVNAESSFIANRAMEIIKIHNPAKYQEWINVKSIASDYKKAGLIDSCDYALVKETWHKINGLPYSHYSWKTGNSTINNLPETLQIMLRG